jgi:hypothetical protein
VPLDSIDDLYGCLKDLPGDPLADLEAEHRLELLRETDRYIADLVAEVEPPSAAQRKRAAALARRLARRSTRQKD